MWHSPGRERKNPARQRFGGLAVLGVNATSVVLGQENARSVGSLVQRPATRNLDVRGRAERFAPIVPVEPLPLSVGEMPDQRATAIAARMTGPALPTDGRHENGKRCSHAGIIGNDSARAIVHPEPAHGVSRGFVDSSRRTEPRKGRYIPVDRAEVPPPGGLALILHGAIPRLTPWAAPIAILAHTLKSQSTALGQLCSSYDAIGTICRVRWSMSVWSYNF